MSKWWCVGRKDSYYSRRARLQALLIFSPPSAPRTPLSTSRKSSVLERVERAGTDRWNGALAVAFAVFGLSGDEKAAPAEQRCAQTSKLSRVRPRHAECSNSSETGWQAALAIDRICGKRYASRPCMSFYCFVILFLGRLSLVEKPVKSYPFTKPFERLSPKASLKQRSENGVRHIPSMCCAYVLLLFSD